MKKESAPKNVISLTSDQIADVLARGFWNFLDSTRRYYRDELKADVGILGDKTEGRVNVKQVGEPRLNGISCVPPRKQSLTKVKGHVPIRSQTGHDHDRNHQKH